jgi:hypothetical protein
VVDIPWLAEGAPAVAAPVMTPCPSGWREVVEEDLTHCEPFPESGIADCGAGQAHFPGDPGCTVVGDACPGGDFPEGLTGTVIYVKSGATGGDGSRASPFGALSDVPFASLASGTTVALGKGSYEGALPLRGGVRVVGACASETTLNGIDGPIQAVVTVASSGEAAELRNVSIEDSPQSAVRIERTGGILRLSGVIIDGSTLFGLGILEGTLEGEELVVRNTRDTPAGTSGLGLWALGGHTRLVRTVFEDNRYAGVFAQGTSTEVSIRESLVHDTGPDESSGPFAYGLFALDGAHVEAQSVFFSDQTYGVAAGDLGTEIIVQDVIIHESVRAEGTAAGAIFVREGAQISGSRVLVADNDDAGIGADANGSVRLEDVIIRDVRSFETASFEGVGVQVFGESTIELTRAVVERAVAHGVLISDSAHAELVDLVVRDIRPRASDGLLGRGVVAQFGSIVTLDRGRVERVSEVGLLALDPSTEMMLSDVLVRDTQPRLPVGDYGRGIVAQGEGRISGRRVAVDGTRELGVAAMVSGSVDLAQVVVSNTSSNSCESGSCAAAPHGHGVAGIGGNLELSRFVIRDSELCGAFVTSGGDLSLADGEIREAAIGACVQVEGFDLDYLMEGVTYRDNGTNLEATTLPVPGPVSSI